MGWLELFRHLWVADEQRLPSEVKAQNAKTLEAISELKAGKGKRHRSVKALMADLNEED